MYTVDVLDNARGLGPHDHVCWTYDDPQDFYPRVQEFLADGLGQDQRVCYVGAGDVETLVENVRDLDGMDLALQRGAAQVVSLDVIYPVGAVVEPTAQVQTYATATEAALAAGFTGLRVVADVTALVRTPQQLDAFARSGFGTR